MTKYQRAKARARDEAITWQSEQSNRATSTEY